MKAKAIRDFSASDLGNVREGQVLEGLDADRLKDLAHMKLVEIEQEQPAPKKRTQKAK